MSEKKTYAERIAEETIKGLENGTAPWIKPWEPGQIPDRPINALTGKPYRGFNSMWLSMHQGASADPRWCTYKQAGELGAQVRAGSKGTTVQYVVTEERHVIRDENGQPVVDADGNRRYSTAQLDKPKVLNFTVFHASQIENLPPLPPREAKPEWERHQAAEKLLAASGAVIHHDQNNRAFYRPITDSIHLPPESQFKSRDGYYGTALHEVGHWTGHESRLDRDIRNPFGSEKYAREELRAELASYMLGADLGIGHDPGQHHAYIASWIDVLKKDPREIIRAAQDAEKIMDYVKGLEKGKEAAATVEAKEERAESSQEMAASAPNPAAEKTFLHVPFKEKEAAKALGAKWDRAEKKWYAPEGVDLAPLSKWLEPPEREPEQSPPVRQTLNPREEFAAKLRQGGLILDGEPIFDGKIHRVTVEGGKDRAKDGAYSGYENDGRPGGWWQNHKTGEQGKWLATNHIQSPASLAELKEQAKERLREEQERAQQRLYDKWMSAEPFQPHPYLKNKGITNSVGTRGDRDGHLYVPGYNLETGRLQTMQAIGPMGEKRFEKGCPKQGAVFLLPDREAFGSVEERQASRGWAAEMFGDAEIILIAEGYATGASLYAATGLPVAVAFDAGNLKEAAMAIKKKLPEANIIICADNDHSHASGHNVGVEKAKEAAAAVRGQCIVPAFNPEEKAKGLTDFNDLHQARGLKVVRDQVEKGISLKRTEREGGGITAEAEPAEVER